MGYIESNLIESLIILGILALTVEVAVLGFSTFILLFLGIAMLLTGLGMLIGLLPETLSAALWSSGLLSAGLALALWRPLKNMQKKVDNKRVKQDFANVSFTLQQNVDIEGDATHAYSGIQWKLKSKTPIPAGTRVKVVRSEVGVLWVEVVESE